MKALDLPATGEVPVVTAAQMAEIDRVAVDEIGISVEMLMENAARGVALAARALLGGSVDGRRIVCVAGSGNNGGDALGAARRLRGWGARVRCVLSVARDDLHGDLNKRQLDIARRAGIDVAPAAGARLEEADLIVDGLLGYSVRGAPHGTVAALIAAANASGVPVLAVDLPSGLHPDTGAPLGAAVRAAATVTLGLPKAGLLRPVARPFVGQLLLADIAVPPHAYDRFGIDARGVFVAGDLVRVATAERS
ncbi:MAG: NAD(P)H-hydrate epimerase [Chloroflexota bacterium]|nr:NAD(P)H-hydrate epimerase [Chloroflexota bacterium]MDE3192175.1 NAD(P)H-hydrate epimerase [Chloroflexota bacterium]